MARKGIAPWENGAGQIGTPELKWKQVCTNEIYADTLGGEIAKNTVAHITKNDDAISILYADGTKSSIMGKYQ